MSQTPSPYCTIGPFFPSMFSNGTDDLTRANGITAVWITQPALFGDTIDPTTGVDLAMAKVNGRGNGHLEWRLLEMNNDVLRRVASEAFR
jgi:hypothetical protein